MGSFARWFIGRLKEAPLVTNMTSAALLMVVGDLTAQAIERSRSTSASAAAPAPPLAPGGAAPPASSVQRRRDTRRITFHRYGTLTPDARDLHRDLSKRRTQLAETYRSGDGLAGRCERSIASTRLTVRSYLSAIDLFRMGTMTLWATAVVTPYFVWLYRFMDRYLPHGRTAPAVASRVLGSFLSSIPLNALFFCYGTVVHHTAEWCSLLREWHREVPEASLADLLEEHPLDAPMLASATALKLRRELLPTLQASASVWVPINACNFYWSPPHVRPLVLMVFSAFWNCYLSLAQHRDAEWEAEP